MEKWVLRLVLAVLTVVTCCFVFRNTETKDRSLLYQKVQTMAEDYLGMEGMQPEEYTILVYAENQGEGRLFMVALYRNNTSGSYKYNFEEADGKNQSDAKDIMKDMDYSSLSSIIQSIGNWRLKVAKNPLNLVNIDNTREIVEK